MLNVKAVSSRFASFQEKHLVEAFSVILKTDCETEGSSAAPAAIIYAAIGEIFVTTARVMFYHVILLMLRWPGYIVLAVPMVSPWIYRGRELLDQHHINFALSFIKATVPPLRF